MLDISVPLMCFTAIIFLGLIAYLNRFLYKPILNFMSNRDNMIEQDRKTISKNEQDAIKHEEEAASIRLEAKTQAAKEKALILDDAKKEIASKMEQKRLELAEEYEIFIKNMSEEKDTLKSSLLAQIPLFKEGIKAKMSSL